MKENAIVVELGSHTDCRGTKNYNDNLSQKRAESAVGYIVGEGISIDRITAKGYGESQLLNKCADGVECTPDEHQLNRRTEFKVVSLTPKETIPEYNLDNFKGGEVIADYGPEANFFKNCFLVLPIDTLTPKAIPPAPKDTIITILPSLDSTAKTKTITINKAALHVVDQDVTYTYRVQILSLSKQKSLHDPEFHGLKDVRQYIENESYKYSSGSFATKAEAAEYRIKMVKMGFTDAFVVKDPKVNIVEVSPEIK
jgi:hypothetical protein